jgi:hypothetical protein
VVNEKKEKSKDNSNNEKNKSNNEIKSGNGDNSVKSDIITNANNNTSNDNEFMNSFYSENMTKTILNLMMSSWDRSRRLAADLLLKFPKPLPSFLSPLKITPLANRGCILGIE